MNLIQVMIAAAIGSVLSLAFATMSRQMQTEGSMARARFGATGLAQDLRLQLSTETGCNSLLAGQVLPPKGLSDPETIYTLPSLSLPGVGEIKAGQNLESYAVFVRQLSLVGLQRQGTASGGARYIGTIVLSSGSPRESRLPASLGTAGEKSQAGGFEEKRDFRDLVVSRVALVMKSDGEVLRCSGSEVGAEDLCQQIGGTFDQQTKRCSASAPSCGSMPDGEVFSSLLSGRSDKNGANHLKLGSIPCATKGRPKDAILAEIIGAGAKAGVKCPGGLSPVVDQTVTRTGQENLRDRLAGVPPAGSVYCASQIPSGSVCAMSESSPSGSSVNTRFVCVDGLWVDISDASYNPPPAGNNGDSSGAT
jgi:hypothetical protein